MREVGTQYPLELAAAIFLVRRKDNPYDKSLGISNETLEKLGKLDPIVTAPRAQPKKTSKPSLEPTKEPTKRPINVYIAQKFKLTDPILPKARLDEAKIMAGIYPLLYVLENSIRAFMLRVLNHHIGKNWWDEPDLLNLELKRRVEKRIADENKEPWHGKRGSGVHQIYYTDLGELPEIMTSKKCWKFFKNIIGTQESIKRRIREICLSRNIIMHCNPLSKHDQTRLEVYFRDWENLLEEKMDSIPN
ncbi:hypothetical protein CEE36_08250 [candidate division TA06 bacterium B3_TA06]|uniref:Swt1-like HEPN domain-containing protein n=1 Tax=candidate division TA06 bacterium B3_TA06 TaxID=2012487 RepID=A0A532V2H8_UNCT6|nr:MAG: hypothetical protein CEE36_08250 [candidate division TA06 bacterium B3_TA06]